MAFAQKLRGLALAGLAGVSLVTMAVSASIVVGALTPAYAQVSGEFQAALEPYGEWRRSARWGEVWVPDQRPRGWRPYSVGHWVYTDDWGWFWVSDEDEADWGWVTYHYGRWIFERGMGWFWVPGEEWGPAWVDWRRGDNYVGWAPLPPDDVIYEYEGDPTYWTFVEPRYVTALRVRTYFIPQQRTAVLLRSTVVVNRSFRSGGRIAINPGISPAVIAAASRSPVPTFRVRPRVLASTQGVSGGVPVRPQDLRARGVPRGPNAAPAIAVQRTTTVIQPAASVPKPEALGKDERGRLGTHPPRAAQGGAPQPLQQAPAVQQQAPAPPPPSQRPAQAPALTPATPPPPVNAQPRPEPPRPAPLQQDRRELPRPPAGSAPIRQGEPPPQVRPVRPIVPQTPPPPPPAQSAPRQLPHPVPPPVARPVPPAPPPVVRTAPPPPAARPVAPPPPAAKLPPKPPLKPGEKPPEPPK